MWHSRNTTLEKPHVIRLPSTMTPPRLKEAEFASVLGERAGGTPLGPQERATCGRTVGLPGPGQLLTRGLQLDPLAREGGPDEHLPSTA